MLGLHSYQIFSLAGFSCINECSELSFHSFRQHPHTARCGHSKHSHETPHYGVSLAVELALCRDHYIFTSCHCYHGKERKSSVYRTSTAAISLRCLHISWFPWIPAEWAWLHCASGMPEGRRDVLFSPTMAFTLLCQRLSTSASVIRLPGLPAAHVKACANTQSTKC